MNSKFSFICLKRLLLHSYNIKVWISMNYRATYIMNNIYITDIDFLNKEWDLHQ